MASDPIRGSRRLPVEHKTKSSCSSTTKKVIAVAAAALVIGAIIFVAATHPALTHTVFTYVSAHPTLVGSIGAGAGVLSLAAIIYIAKRCFQEGGSVQGESLEEGGSVIVGFEPHSKGVKGILKQERIEDDPSGAEERESWESKVIDRRGGFRGPDRKARAPRLSKKELSRGKSDRLKTKEAEYEAYAALQRKDYERLGEGKKEALFVAALKQIWKKYDTKEHTDTTFDEWGEATTKTYPQVRIRDFLYNDILPIVPSEESMVPRWGLKQYKEYLHNFIENYYATLLAGEAAGLELTEELREPFEKARTKMRDLDRHGLFLFGLSVLRAIRPEKLGRELKEEEKRYLERIWIDFPLQALHAGWTRDKIAEEMPSFIKARASSSEE